MSQLLKAFQRKYKYRFTIPGRDGPYHVGCAKLLTIMDRVTRFGHRAEISIDKKWYPLTQVVGCLIINKSGWEAGRDNDDGILLYTGYTTDKDGVLIPQG